MGKKLTYREKSALCQKIIDAMDKRDWTAAKDAARILFFSSPDDPDMFHLILAAFIDGQDAKMAKDAATIYQKKFPLKGQGCFYLGRAAHMNGEWQAAEEYFLAALKDDDLPKWYRGAVYSILGTLCREEGRVKEAADYYLRSFELKSFDTGKLSEYSNYLFNLHYLNKDQPFMLAAAKGYGALFDGAARYSHTKRERAKIRLGYISPDLRFHVVAFFSYAFFHDYDRERFEVYCYTDCAEDGASRNIAAMVDVWRNVRGLKYETVADVVYRDNIDILIDLAGHTAWNFLPALAHKPAPVQISGIGYFDTTGLGEVDYFLADHYTDPPENDAYFTEKLLRLSKSHFCFMWHDAPEEVRPAPCLSNGYVTFGSFNNFSKVTDEQLKLWAKILDKVPRSRLYLKASIFNNPYGKKIALRRIKAAGIDEDRLIIAPHEPKYLTSYHRIDIALDTYPYPGGGTTCDALYMGVPVVTLVGERHNSRFGYSLLMNLGLVEGVAFSPDEYAAKAVALAADFARLNALRLGLRRRMLDSPLMQAKNYMAELEMLYEGVWFDWLADGKFSSAQTAEQMELAAAAENWREVLRLASVIVFHERKNGRAWFLGATACDRLQKWDRAAWWIDEAIKYNEGTE